jgi:flagellar basal-body rod protein FlgG
VTTNILGAQELSYLTNLSAGEGYQVLNKNLSTAVTNFEKTPQAQSSITQFESQLAKTTTVSQFVNNPTLVDFVLSAFGLDSEDNYQGLIREVLTQDPNNANSLVNQLTDPRFKQMATALNLYANGLGELKAAGLSSPTSATSAEGVTLKPLASTTSSTQTTAAISSVVEKTSVNSNIAVGIGVQLTGNQYFSVQEPSGKSTSIGISVTGDQYIPVNTPGGDTSSVSVSVSNGQYLEFKEADGSIGYLQSATATINSQGYAALADGSVLQPPIQVPSNATNVSVDSSGNVYATLYGSTTPENIGQLQTATFSNPSQLATDANGYYTATSGSGAAVLGTPSNVSSYETTGYVQSGTFTLNSSNQLALPDGTTLAPPVTFPTGTTSVNIDSSGNIDAYVNGSTTATVVGTLQTANFTGAQPVESGGYYNTDNAPNSVSTPSTFTTFGATAYSQTGYFTIDPNGNLALADGSELNPPVAIPSGVTSLSIDSEGVITGQVQGQSTPSVLGQLQVSTFSNPSQLSTDAFGLQQPTTGSGAATSATLGSFNTFGATNQVQTTYTIPATTAVTKTGSGAVSVGIGVSGNEYLVLQNSQGNPVYTQSGYFTLNSKNQLQLPDGTTFNDGTTFPAGTTAVTIDSSGNLYAQVKGQTKPQEVGSIEIATFSNPSKLQVGSNGLSTATTGSGPAQVSFVSNKSSYAFGNTTQTLVNDYVTNEFEIAVGANNSAVREALYFSRTVSTDEASAKGNETTEADIILGDSVLDNVAITALGQPAQIAYEQLSSQEKIIETGVQLNQLQNPKYVAQFTAQYLAAYDAKNPVGSSGTGSGTTSAALQILQSFSSGSSSSSSSSSSSILSLLT